MFLILLFTFEFNTQVRPLKVGIVRIYYILNPDVFG